MKTQNSYKSYELMNLSDNSWAFKSGQAVFSKGNLMETVEVMVNVFGFDFDEVYAAVADMEDKANQYAYFGMDKIFLYSEDLPFQNVKGIA